jgi:hypothetical protein
MDREIWGIGVLYCGGGWRIFQRKKIKNFDVEIKDVDFE